MLNVLKDTWFLFGRLFPFPPEPGLRRVGNPDRSSPVLVTCNFELTVREVTETLTRDGIDCWLLVAPTRLHDLPPAARVLVEPRRRCPAIEALLGHFLAHGTG